MLDHHCNKYSSLRTNSSRRFPGNFKCCSDIHKSVGLKKIHEFQTLSLLFFTMFSQNTFFLNVAALGLCNRFNCFHCVSFVVSRVCFMLHTQHSENILVHPAFALSLMFFFVGFFMFSMFYFILFFHFSTTIHSTTTKTFSKILFMC